MILSRYSNGLNNIFEINKREVMKIFEIGNGQTVIKGPSHYYSCNDGDSTVILYRGEDDDEPLIRFSVISFKRAEGVTQKVLLQDFKDKARQKNAEAVTYKGKSYFSYVNEDEEELYMHLFEVMYGDDIVIVSLTANKEDSGSDELAVYLKEIEEMIRSIDSLSSLEFPLLEPKYDDVVRLETASAKILGIAAEDLQTYHESGDSITKLQEILNLREYAVNDYEYHQALGILFGACFQYQYSDFHWIVVHDQYGRELALQYQDYALQCFPISMITKRIEDEVDIDVIALMEDVVQHIETGIERDKGYTRLEYNY
ncbi:DUF3806 domain-containing protein [Myroides odoratimimus]|uniref:DUF3806 domain-containing protein n=1 Tax=Myroides odoratimimus TaxID=76832 RepID=UPI0025786CE1|nr:DUF3806 domain-containing protein [Myroides odoratimimus]MDM1395861.1 DUF3806 domain-containing protein [Myroides odoratimimus]